MEEKKPRVSVLIPAYNAEKFIRRTVNSVLAQTFGDFEIIIVDDGSKDSTGKIVGLMRKKDQRIIYYYQDNRGLASARNRLFELSRGEFLAFIDHDDEWMPQKLEKQLEVFKNNPGTAMVFSDAFIKNNGKLLGSCFSERRPFRGNVFYEYLFSDNFVPLLTVMLSRSVLAEFIPFNTHYQVNEEFDLFLRISRDYKIDYVDEALAVYHIHGGNTIISKHRRFIEESFAILDYWIKNDSAVSACYRKQLNRRIAQLHYKNGLYYLSVRDYSQVFSAILSSFGSRILNFDAAKLTLKLLFRMLGRRDGRDAESIVRA